MQPLGTKKNDALFRDTKITQPLGTKKSYNLSGHKKSRKNMPPLHTKKLMQLLETKKSHATSREEKK